MGKINIYMPSLGEGIIEASVLKLLKDVGDKVEEDEPVIEIATDKVDTEIVALEKGIIEAIRVKPGDVVKVGEVVVVMKTETVNEGYSTSVEGPKGKESFVLKKGSSKKKSPGIRKEKVFTDQENASKKNKVDEAYKSPMQEAVSHSETPQKIFLSPLVKKIMKEEDLSYKEVVTLKGSGYMDRITRDDILKYLKYKKEGAIHGEEPKEITISSTVSREKGVSEDKMGSEGAGRKKEGPIGEKKEMDVSAKRGEGFTEKEMDRVRMLIAEHTLQSKKISPHVTSFIEVDVTYLKQTREDNKEKFMKNCGIKLTYTPLFIAATAMALEKFPEINSSISGKKIRYYHNINIGIATALANGNLIVPVIKNTESLNIRGIITKLSELTEKARTNSLDPGDIMGGTFTISNFGSFNTMAGTPIIVQPQSAILGIGEIKKRAVVIESDSGDSIAIRPITIISLSFDHRIIDGALAGNFLGYLRECIENFKL